MASGQGSVLVWEDDPGAPPNVNQPVSRPRPQLGVPPLPVGISGSAPTQGSDQPGSAEFRYWSAADALSRAAGFWGPSCRRAPGGTPPSGRR
jgi:hypothetical protein